MYFISNNSMIQIFMFSKSSLPTEHEKIPITNFIYKIIKIKCKLFISFFM